MTREIALDSETTGLSVAQGHRIVSLGVVEIVHGRITGNEREWFFNPERPCDPSAYAVHRLNDRWLAGQPRFRAVSREIEDFIGDSIIVAQNAKFDRGHLNAEFARLLSYSDPAMTQASRYPEDRWVDSLAIARKRYPQQKNGLDDLADRFGIYRGHRIKHGALKDARILSEVWLAMQRGGQTDLLGSAAIEGQRARISSPPYDYAARKPPPSRLTSAEAARWDEVWGKGLGENAIWNDYLKGDDDAVPTEQQSGETGQVQGVAPARGRKLRRKSRS